MLVPNARACIQCGQLIPERSGNEPFQVEAPVVLPGYSRLKIHETPEVRDLDLVVANEAIEHIKDFFPSLAGGRPLGQFKSTVNSQAQLPLVEVDVETPSLQPQLPAAQTPHLSAKHSTNQKIWEVFRERDGKLVQEMLKLKASSKRDYVIRLASLYLYAQECRGEERVPRDEIFRILDEAGVKDTNTSTYIYGSGIRLDEETETVRLTLEARIKAQQYLTDIFDSDVPDGWYPRSPTRSANGHAKKPAKRGSERHSGSDALVAEWVALPKTQELNQKYSQTITGKFSAENKALFGLYCLDKAGVTTEVQPTLLSKYLYSAFQLKVPPDGIRFRGALRKIPAHVVRKEESAGYRITPSGITHMEQLLQSSK